MTSPRQAEENIEIIRTLLERTTLYRTVSVPAAAWGGGLAVAAWGFERQFLTARYPYPGHFFALWLGVLALAALGNLFFLAREARQNGSPTFSAGFWAAGRSLLPAFFCAGFFTVVFVLSFSHAGRGGPFVPLSAALLWIFFYGLGLLATQHFAPRSIAVLGWLFLLTPLLWGCALSLRDTSNPEINPVACFFEYPSALMALTFGGYHLGYALIVFLLERRKKAGVGEGIRGL